MEIRFLGHACFELSEGDARVFIDPFLSPNNPSAPVSAGEMEPTQVLVSHGHADHMADAVALAKRTAPTAWRSSRWPTGSPSRASRRSTTSTSAARSGSTGDG